MHVNQAARQFRTAQESYHTAFRDHFANDIEALMDERFWQLHTVFLREVVLYRIAYGRSHGIGQAAEELFRKPLAGDFRGYGESGADKPLHYSMTEAIQFAKSWQRLSRRLYEPLFNVVEDRSDDAYGDLLDALPLARREVAENSLGRMYGNGEQFEEAVRDACGGHPELAQLILRGENYVGMALQDAARDYYASAAAP